MDKIDPVRGTLREKQRIDTYVKQFMRKLSVLAKHVYWRPVMQFLASCLRRLRFTINVSHGIILTIDHLALWYGKLSVSGWALTAQGAAGIQRIDVYGDGTWLGQATYGDSRADVQESYPFIRQSGICGFHFYTDMPELTEPGTDSHTIIIKATRSDGRSYEQRRLVANTYQDWIARHEPDSDELATQRQIRFAPELTISLIVAADGRSPIFLQEMIASVVQQTYSHWELCIAIYTGQTSDLQALLDTYIQHDRRIKVTCLPETASMAAQLNAALSVTTGEFVGWLDQADTLAPFALFEIVQCLHTNPEGDYLYSDEDLLSEEGGIRCHPYFKPDWSPDLLRSANYLSHLSVVRKTLLEQIGGFREGFDDAEDYDLALRATEQAKHIVHIPRVLYHHRYHPDSQDSGDFASAAHPDCGRKALQEHLERIHRSGHVEALGRPGWYKVTYRLDRVPTISIIIPNKDHREDLEKCVHSILTRSNYQDLEILIVENGSTQPEVFKVYDRLKRDHHIRILEWQHPFNYAAINNFAVTQARGEVMVFLNNDTEAINSDWLDRMVEHAVRSEVGAVGAKLYYPDDTIQHAGLIVGISLIVEHYQKFFPRNEPGYMGRLQLIQNVSAVTAACLMTRKTVFQEVGGFDARYEIAFNDVDLCLKIREKGYWIVWTPCAELYHYESKTRAHEEGDQDLRFAQEKRLFCQQWNTVLEQGDPFYNPNLPSDMNNFSL